MAQDKYLVFEAINDKLKEIFVGMSSIPMHMTIERLRTSPPAAIKHWDLADVQTFRSVEFELPKADAIAFVREYVKNMAPGQWRYLSDLP